MRREELTGIVLAGGRASRFDAGGGVDKGLLLLAGQSLLAHSCHLLKPLVHGLIISANRHFEYYQQYAPVYPDDPRFGLYQGPLAGLATCLNHIDTPWAYVHPVDLPLLRPQVFARLAAAAKAGTCQVLYVQAARTHPLSLLIHRDLAPAVEQYVLSGQQRVMHFLREQELQGNAQAVACHDVDEACFINVNTLEQLTAAEHLIAQRQSTS